ncbi:MAG: response regulator transcription factor [Clostridia bacterium]|nr:response regulator transcription factor [Clostridia bacterium]
MNLHIAICDDDRVQTEYMKTAVMTWAKDNAHLCEIATFSSAEAFLFEYSENGNFDILLLDIEMGQMNGVDLARRLRKDNDRLQIIFVTGYDKYIADGYDVAALHYLMKPVDKDKLFSVLDRAAKLISDREKMLVIIENKTSEKIPLHKIIYIEAQQNYVVIHTADGERRVRAALSAVEKQLDDGFFRTGKSFIVGMRYVASISKTEIKLDDGTQIPLGRGLYDNAQRAFIKFY